MFRSRLLCARLLSTTTTPPSASPPSPFRLRFSSLIFFTSAGVLVSSYFFWPSKYRGSPTYSNKPLSPSYFVPVTVSDNSKVGPDLAVLTLSIPPGSHSSDEKKASSFDPIWSIFIKDDDIQVERPYTPLFGIDEKGAIKLWVKRYSRGEVGRWLHSKKAGDTIEIRGPLKTFPFQEGKWDEVVMVCLRLPPSRPFSTFSDTSLADIWRDRLFAVPPVIISTASQRPRLSQYPLYAPSRVSESCWAPSFAPFTTSGRLCCCAS